MQFTPEEIIAILQQMIMSVLTIIGYLTIVIIVILVIDPPEIAVKKLKNSIPTENNPSKESLLRIVNHKKFKKLPTYLKKAINEKLKCYSYEPAPIEATMTLAQLHNTKSPLWTTNLEIALVDECYELQRLLIFIQDNPKITNLGKYIEEYVIERKQGVSQPVAQNKQLKKIEKDQINETTIKN